MCNLCRRIETIKTIESILLKPLISILCKFHEKSEPGLGDVLIWREARINAIQKRLLPLQIGPLKYLIRAIIADLESELAKIQIKKMDHPAMWSVGKLNSLKENIRPDESSSIRAWKTNRAEEARVAKSTVAPQSITRTQDHMEQDLLVDDLFPHPDNLQWSTQLVDEWFAKNSDVWLSEGASGEYVRKYGIGSR
ncbi:6fe901b9-0cde-4467-930d-150d637c1c63 [Sclerotinia trifoliorum]|uniref:6fe901b9-0cde-4467-930d-150d637c1c63 n=1 Tax=Sclerotinia trifoliorum TaxID=28548 RepID=A0A8H2VZF5_9HELO|nr:6fe901b9-0cde-4467-930d-150d637c1c63 [Sclerotinia trifoliorum]